MKRLSLYFLFAVAFQSFCVAAVTKLSADYRKVLEDSSRFHEVLAVTNLPSSIVALCADCTGKIAGSGQNWSATDAVTNTSLPRQCLIWAAVAGEYYVVHYERGGRGHSFHLLVATMVKGNSKPKVIWRGVGGQLKDYAAFLDALRNGKLDDNLDYAH